MVFEETEIKGCFIIKANPVEDERGWFGRFFCKNEIKPFFDNFEIVQINHSFNKKKGSFRGMHYQKPPFAEAKLIRCVAGSIVDFVLDIRKNSPTFLKWISVELSSANRKSIYLPKGMAHGFQTLTDNTELIYYHNVFYNKDSDSGIRYNDPLINIKLPLDITVISDKDIKYLLLDSNFKGIQV